MSDWWNWWVDENWMHKPNNKWRIYWSIIKLGCKWVRRNEKAFWKKNLCDRVNEIINEWHCKWIIALIRQAKEVHADNLFLAVSLLCWTCCLACQRAVWSEILPGDAPGIRPLKCYITFLSSLLMKHLTNWSKISDLNKIWRPDRNFFFGEISNSSW